MELERAMGAMLVFGGAGVWGRHETVYLPD